MDKLNDLKNRLEVFNTLGNASNSHETTAALPNEKTDFLQKDNESKSIITQNILENENLLLRNKDKRNIQYDSDLNSDKSNFPSDEIFISYSKTFRMSQNIRNNKEINNIKLENSFQTLATANVRRHH